MHDQISTDEAPLFRIVSKQVFMNKTGWYGVSGQTLSNIQLQGNIDELAG